jgi:antitoxin component of RelBE/YafQ-DinJ toxin-antitoxin module
VNVLDESLIPVDYFLTQDPVLSRKNLLEALKEGVNIPGVELKQSESLRIR